MVIKLDMSQEILHKEIDLIQGTINRMATNSFYLKGWTVSIIVAVLALTDHTIIDDEPKYFTLVLLLPLAAFWYLDAYFVHKEKCYRELYNWVITNRNKSSDHLYCLNYKRFEGKLNSSFKMMWSGTLLLFYGMITLILLLITLYNFI